MADCFVSSGSGASLLLLQHGDRESMDSESKVGGERGITSIIADNQLKLVLAEILID